SLSYFFQAEDGIRDRNVTGVQTCALPIYSASPRSMSTRRNVKRPAWSAERRLQRATSRTGPSVSAAPLAMCCILCSHGSFVHPPSAKTAHRATIYAQTAGLVPARGARPAVVPHARSVPRARVRVHAAADAGEPRGGVLPAVSGTLPRSRHAGAGAGAPGARGVGWAGILCPSAKSPCAREKRYTTAGRHVARTTG